MLKNIIARYRYKEFKEIPESKLHEFVGPIITKGNMKILATWVKHFESMKVPFVITKHKAPYREGQIVDAKFLVCEIKA